MGVIFRTFGVDHYELEESTVQYEKKCIISNKMYNMKRAMARGREDVEALPAAMKRKTGAGRTRRLLSCPVLMFLLYKFSVI